MKKYIALAGCLLCAAPAAAQGRGYRSHEDGPPPASYIPPTEPATRVAIPDQVKCSLPCTGERAPDQAPVKYPGDLAKPADDAKVPDAGPIKTVPKTAPRVPAAFQPFDFANAQAAFSDPKKTETIYGETEAGSGPGIKYMPVRAICDDNTEIIPDARLFTLSVELRSAAGNAKYALAKIKIIREKGSPAGKTPNTCFAILQKELKAGR